MKKGTKVFVLHSENLTNLGGPMGTEYTFDNWTKLFADAETAKAAAERDYRRQTDEPEKIVWKRERDGWHTQDLRFVMYHVEPRTVG